tara:strand:+ start:986 stop:1180 length:195 start_codon:yes stop_codon:yes gene_type:complete
LLAAQARQEQFVATCCHLLPRGLAGSFIVLLTLTICALPVILSAEMPAHEGAYGVDAQAFLDQD